MAAVSSSRPLNFRNPPSHTINHLCSDIWLYHQQSILVGIQDMAIGFSILGLIPTEKIYHWLSGLISIILWLDDSLLLSLHRLAHFMIDIYLNNDAYWGWCLFLITNIGPYLFDLRDHSAFIIACQYIKCSIPPIIITLENVVADVVRPIYAPGLLQDLYWG